MIEHLAKRSAHVAVVCRRFAPLTVVCVSAMCIKYFLRELIHLSAGSDLIRYSLFKPDKVICICAALLASKDIISFFCEIIVSISHGSS